MFSHISSVKLTFTETSSHSESINEKTYFLVFLFNLALLYSYELKQNYYEHIW